jgi:hypothetical protein
VTAERRLLMRLLPDPSQLLLQCRIDDSREYLYGYIYGLYMGSRDHGI